jgi:hypothetical protein
MGADDDAARAWAAVAELYHRYLTGMILTMVTRRDARTAADVVGALFRRQHHQRFLPGLQKLGIAELPDAVKCAAYHYLSNGVGGVGVEFVRESDRKAWVRFVPPRWIYDGVAICAVPSAVSRAVLEGWYARNGVSLGNPRLGFVCTGQTTDAQPGLMGYFIEEDRDLAPEERLRFRPGEEPPPFDPAAAPVLESTAWPPERLAKAARNYAMDYIANLLPVMAEVLGPAEAGHLGRVTGQLIGMSYGAAVTAMLGRDEDRSLAGFAAVLVALARAQGDEAEWAHDADGDGIVVRQTTWRLVRDQGALAPSVFEAWNGLWEGMLAVHDRFARLTVRSRLDQGDGAFVWALARRQPPIAG